MSFIDDMTAALDRFPNLTRNGFERPGADGFESWRAEMLHPVTLDEFDRALGWLSHVQRAKRGGADSYELKHVVEDWCGVYVCNGAMIAAAAHAGFRVEWPGDGLNATLGVGSPRYWPLGASRKYDWIRERYRNRTRDLMHRVSA